MKFSVIISCILYTCIVQHSEQRKYAEPVYDSELIDALMEDYNRLARPGTAANNNTITVNIELTLSRINSLKEDVLTVTGWLYLNWRDSRLAWNSSEFNGLTSVEIPADQLWLPDITLYSNAAAGKTKYQMVDPKASLYEDGTVDYVPQVQLESFCADSVSDNVTEDTVSCDLKFGSWSHHGNKIDVASRINQLSRFYLVPNKHLQLVNSNVIRHDVTYDFGPNPFPDVTIAMILKRNN